MHLTKHFLISFLSLSIFISAQETVKPNEISGREKLLSIVAGEWLASSLYAAAEMDIASYLTDGPKSSKELASLIKCDEDHLYRILRLLASHGIFHEEDGHIFSNTSTSELLSKEHPESLQNLVVFYSKEMSESMRHLKESIVHGKPAFQMTYDQSVFAYFKEHPQTALLFNASMKEKSKAVISSCLKAYDFTRFSSVYDIGGGMGHFLSALLQSSSEMKGLLYELPHVIEQAKISMSPFPQCTLQSGDFFESIPEGGSAYLLKAVIHDWNDEQAEKILLMCHKAMSPNARLIIIEPILTEANHPEYAKAMDVYMMAITGGKERTFENFKKILDRSGFVIESLTPTETEFSIIQAKKM